MARSDNTAKGSWPAYAYPRGRRFKENYRTPAWKRARRREHLEIASGREPAPQHHRHSALWDAF
jgi:hypothetical protein